MSCPALDVNGNACRFKGPFCKFHTYMKDYTPEMITNSTLCSGCKKMKYLTQKRCDECRSRVKIKKEIIVCAKPDCKFKKSELNKYCGKHQLCVFIDETTALGLKCCVNSIRGCRSQIPLDSTSRCPSCLKSDRVMHFVKNMVMKNIKSFMLKKWQNNAKIKMLKTKYLFYTRILFFSINYLCKTT